MKKSKQFLAGMIVTFYLLLGFNTSTFAANKGKELYDKLLCASCHGKDGKGILCRKTKKNKKTGKIKCVKGEPKPAFVMYPKLAGQNELYLHNQMKDLLITRKRNSELSKAMYDVVVKAGLLEKYSVKGKELKKIAKYLSKVK